MPYFSVIRKVRINYLDIKKPQCHHGIAETKQSVFVVGLNYSNLYPEVHLFLQVLEVEDHTTTRACNGWQMAVPLLNPVFLYDVLR